MEEPTKEPIKEEVKQPQEEPLIKETASMIQRADEVAKRMEEANKRSEELLTRQEAIASRLMLSGKAQAGTETKTPTQLAQEKIDAEVKAALERFN